mmetsp:Transcript_22231/g.57986  ORF Transcript_22231/g.57986 Transcript_22231/m.57986 type:complete len:84 (+) Transcript_22231:246-497(+)|eukprot:1138650-Pelagomonas_calceolata.AAC.1
MHYTKRLKHGSSGQTDQQHTKSLEGKPFFNCSCISIPCGQSWHKAPHLNISGEGLSAQLLKLVQGPQQGVQPTQRSRQQQGGR